MATTPLPQRLLKFLNPDGTVNLPWYRWFQQTQGATSSGSEGPPGPAGPAGPSGPAGPAGAQNDILALLSVAQANAAANAPGQVFMGGTPGPQGDDGDDGSPGPPGAAGVTGATGATGPAGPQGAQGSHGFDGEDGEQGPIGIGVTSVSLSTPLGGGTVTTSGTLGTSSYTAHGVLIGEGSSALAVTSAGTAGQVLTSNGASSDPTFQNTGWVLISEVTTAGSQATVSFSSIPATYRDLILVVRGRGDNSSTFVSVQIQVNGDTGSNYDYEYLDVSGAGAVSGAQNIGVTNFAPGYIAAATAPANVPGATETRLYDYRGTTFQKAFTGMGNVKLANSAGNMFLRSVAGQWRSTSAISSILVFLSAGNFVNGSILSLYGSL